MGAGTFRWRAAARLVDLIVFGWFASFVLIEIDGRLLGGDLLGRQRADIDLATLRSILIIGVVGFCYEVVPMVWKGATLGKAMLGLRVVDEWGAWPSLPAATLRWIVLFAGPLAFPRYGFVLTAVLGLTALAGRAVHDRLADTSVVSVRDETGD